MKPYKLALPLVLAGCSPTTTNYTPAVSGDPWEMCLQSVKELQENQRTLEDVGNKIYANLSAGSRHSAHTVSYGDLSHFNNVRALDEGVCQNGSRGLRFMLWHGDGELWKKGRAFLQIGYEVPTGKANCIEICHPVDDFNKARCEPLIKVKDLDLIYAISENLLKATENHFSNTKNPTIEKELMKAYDTIMDIEGY